MHKMSAELKKQIVKRIADGINEFRPDGKLIEEIADVILKDIAKAEYIYVPPVYHEVQDILDLMTSGVLVGLPPIEKATDLSSEHKTSKRASPNA
jgi:hypothetical protein